MRTVIFSTEQLKESFWNKRPDMEILKRFLASGPTVRGEWGAPFALEPDVYALATKGDRPSIQRILDYNAIDETRVCCEFRDMVLTDEGIVAEIIPAGPKRDTFEEYLAKDTYRFIPRYFFDKENKLCIMTFDVVAR